MYQIIYNEKITLVQNFGSDSEEHVKKQLHDQRDRWQFAISQLTKETIKRAESLDEETKV